MPLPNGSAMNNAFAVTAWTVTATFASTANVGETAFRAMTLWTLTTSIANWANFLRHTYHSLITFSDRFEKELPELVWLHLRLVQFLEMLEVLELHEHSWRSVQKTFQG